MGVLIFDVYLQLNSRLGMIITFTRMCQRCSFWYPIYRPRLCFSAVT